MVAGLFCVHRSARARMARNRAGNPVFLGRGGPSRARMAGYTRRARCPPHGTDKARTLCEVWLRRCRLPARAPMCCACTSTLLPPAFAYWTAADGTARQSRGMAARSVWSLVSNKSMARARCLIRMAQCLLWLLYVFFFFFFFFSLSEKTGPSAPPSHTGGSPHARKRCDTIDDNSGM